VQTAIHRPSLLLSLHVLAVLLVAATFATPVVAQSPTAGPAAAAHTTAQTQPPQWVWVQPDNLSRRQLQQEMTLVSAPASAQLKLAADFCTAEVLINNRSVCVAGPYAPTVSLDITQDLRFGANQVCIRLQKSPGPSAVALSISAVDAEGTQLLNTGPHWTAVAPGTLQDLGTVQPQLWGIGSASLELSGADNYEQWRLATAANSETQDAKLRTRPGFRITRLRTAGPEEGSWVSMAFDPAGQLTIAREDKGLLRFARDSQGLPAGAAELINGDLLECRGLLYAHGSLYANANNSKALYRLRDMDGNGTL